MPTMTEGDCLKKQLIGAVRNDLLRRLQRLDPEDKRAASELAQIVLHSEGEECEEAFEALCEILFPESVFNGFEVDIAAEAEARQRVDAYRRKVGVEIKRRRRALGLTQQQLAEAAGIPQSHVSRLECGKHAPTHVTIERIAKALRTTAAQLDPGFEE